MFQSKSKLAVLKALPLLAAFAVGGFSIAHAQSPTPTPVPLPPVSVESINVPHTVAMKPYRDPWPSNKERLLDVSEDANKQFDAFLNTPPAGEVKQNFSYANSNVTLTYDKAPSSPFFVARINATGLKPNFCYQLKLVGKPTRGTRGWGAEGDDWANDAIGTHGRWWCDTSHASATNFYDYHYNTFYKGAAAGAEHDMYGYLYTGMFVTDSLGSTSGDFYFTGEYNFHVTWKDAKAGNKHHFAGEGVVEGGKQPGQTAYYGYGNTAPTVGSSTVAHLGEALV